MMTQSEIDNLNTKIHGGNVQFVDHSEVNVELNEGLITEDGKVIYTIDEQIPVMLPEKGIGTTQL